MWRNYTQHSPAIILSRNTNVYPAFGNQHKIERNRRLTSSIMKLNFGMWHIGQGEKPIETTNDPLKRKPELIIQRGREEMSVAGRSRGMIRPAAPGQVNWKYPYWIREKGPAMPQRIGPFTQGSLEKQSILYRISTTFSNLGGGR